MKFIRKNAEPQQLKEYRETTPNASYDGYIDSNQELKKALLNEQGYLCAYCMSRINLKMNTDLKKFRIEIEHLKPQQSHPELQPDYKNMIGVCNGISGRHLHCDKTRNGKGDGSKELTKLNPLDQYCEKSVTYTADGRIKSVSNDQGVEYDLNIMLNLNN